MQKSVQEALLPCRGTKSVFRLCERKNPGQRGARRVHRAVSETPLNRGKKDRPSQLLESSRDHLTASAVLRARPLLDWPYRWTAGGLAAGAERPSPPHGSDARAPRPGLDKNQPRGKTPIEGRGFIPKGGSASPIPFRAGGAGQCPRAVARPSVPGCRRYRRCGGDGHW